MDNTCTITYEKTSSPRRLLPEIGKSYSEGSQAYDGTIGLSPTHRMNSLKIEDHHIGQIPPEEPFPDGGFRAWMVVFGTACSSFSTFGILNSFGVFQTYYQESLLKEYSPSTIAWIGSLQFSLVSFPGLLVGRLFDIGYFRHIFTSASILLVTATFLIAECTRYWQFVLCQGIAIGLACSGLFGCSSAVIPHWFKKKRSSALAYMAFGSAISGTAVPIVCQRLLPRIGFPWTMRILGFTLLVTIGISNLTVRPRLPPAKVEGGTFNIAVFKTVPFTAFCIASLILALGIYTLLCYVSMSLIKSGSTTDLAFYFVAFSNASSLFGRWSAGLLGDIAGPLNIMIPYLFLIGIMTFAWPFLHSTASLFVVTIVYGFSVGSYVALSMNPIMNMGGEGDVGSRVGMYLTVTAFGILAGPPISGAIIAGTDGFKAVGIYAGSSILLGGVLMLYVRFLLLKRWFGRI